MPEIKLYKKSARLGLQTPGGGAEVDFHELKILWD